MVDDRIKSAVGVHHLPAPIRAISSLPDINYADQFSLPTDVSATPEQWARAMFGDVPNLGELLVWRVVLGLRLIRDRTPDAVAGWRIGGRGDDWIRLEAESNWLRGNLLVTTTGAAVSLTTLLRYEQASARAAWPPLSAVHRRLVPRVLRDAVVRIRNGTTR
jgi:hypothetical protein